MLWFDDWNKARWEAHISAVSFYCGVEMANNKAAYEVRDRNNELVEERKPPSALRSAICCGSTDSIARAVLSK